MKKWVWCHFKARWLLPSGVEASTKACCPSRFSLNNRGVTVIKGIVLKLSPGLCHTRTKLYCFPMVTTTRPGNNPQQLLWCPVLLLFCHLQCYYTGKKIILRGDPHQREIAVYNWVTSESAFLPWAARSSVESTTIDSPIGTALHTC